MKKYFEVYKGHGTDVTKFDYLSKAINHALRFGSQLNPLKINAAITNGSDIVTSFITMIYDEYDRDDTALWDDDKYSQIMTAVIRMVPEERPHGFYDGPNDIVVVENEDNRKKLRNENTDNDGNCTIRFRVRISDKEILDFTDKLFDSLEDIFNHRYGEDNGNGTAEIIVVD